MTDENKEGLKEKLPTVGAWLLGLFTTVLAAILVMMIAGGIDDLAETNKALAAQNILLIQLQVKVDMLNESMERIPVLSADLNKVEGRVQRIEDTRFSADEAKLVRSRISSLEQRVTFIEAKKR